MILIANKLLGHYRIHCGTFWSFLSNCKINWPMDLPNICNQRINLGKWLEEILSSWKMQLTWNNFQRGSIALLLVSLWCKAWYKQEKILCQICPVCSVTGRERVRVERNPILRVNLSSILGQNRVPFYWRGKAEFHFTQRGQKRKLWFGKTDTVKL